LELFYKPKDILTEAHVITAFKSNLKFQGCFD
jgi:hypothetical protein